MDEYEVEAKVGDETHDVLVDEIAKEMLDGLVELPAGRPFLLRFLKGSCPSLAEGRLITAGKRTLEVTHIRTLPGQDFTDVFTRTV